MNIIRTETYDVIVVGGGPAGVCAAVSAARKKKRVLLVEKYGFLGGMGTAAMFSPWRGFFAGKQKVVSGMADEIVERLISFGGSPGHCTVGEDHVTPFDAESLKYVLQEFVLESNVTLLLHAECIEVSKNGSAVESVLLHCREGIVRAAARVFVDATGTAEVAIPAGARFTAGNSYASYRFSMTEVDATALRRYAAEHPREMLSFGEDPEGRFAASGFLSLAKQWFAEQGELHPVQSIEIDSDIVPGNVIVSMITIPSVDPSSIERMSFAGMLSQRIPGIAAAFLQRHLPGFADARVLVTPPQPGFRSARRVEGIVPITYAKVMSGESYYDSVGTFALPGSIQATFQVSKRSMLIPECGNVIVAGRAILPMIALFSTNNQPASMKMGEAAGQLAAHL